jgi:hypothetical protein
MKDILVDKLQQSGCISIDGSMIVYFFPFFSHINCQLFMMRDLSCLCPTYVDGGEEEEYDNLYHAQYMENQTFGAHWNKFIYGIKKDI